jgi:hypothetical protein
MNNLLQLQSATELYSVLETDQVADEIRQGRCNVRRLTLEITYLLLGTNTSLWYFRVADLSIARTSRI